jgi:hypothetical protein
LVQAVQIIIWPVAFLSNAFTSTDTMPAWMGAVAVWNPMSATAQEVRELYGNPVWGGGGSWATEHAMLLALAFLQSGPIAGPVISTTAILIGMIAAPALKLLRLSRVAFLGTLIAIVVSVLGAMALQFNQPALGSAFPVVVTALIVERWWNAWEADGPKMALRMTTATQAVALVIQLLVAAPPMLALAARAPLALPLAGVAMMIALGRYNGLRLSELARFRAAQGA